MKTFISLAFILILTNFKLFSQTEPIEGSIEYQKGEKRAAIVEVPFPPEVVEDALKDYLAKGEVKEERHNGMQVFKNARLTPTDGEVADLYFKVVKKSSKDDNNSIVYLIMGRPNENVALRTPDDAFRIQDAKSFLSTLHPQTKSYELERNISINDDNFKKSERKLNDLREDRKRLDKKINEMEMEVNRLKSEKETLIGKRGK